MTESEDQLRSALDQAAQLWEAILPRLGVVDTAKQAVEDADEEAETALPPVPAVKDITYIDDVHKYKSSLTVSAGARPVTDLSTFEDFDPKL